MAFADSFILQSETGARLSCRHEAAADTPRAIIMLNHGLAEHSARYEAFAKALSSAGFHVYTHDHRGHGLTTAPDAPLGRFAAKGGGANIVADAIAVRDMAADRHPGLPVINFGHSMGGMIALRTVETVPDKYEALAVWNSDLTSGLLGLVAAGLFRIERMLKGSDVPSGLGQKLVFDAWGKSVPDHKTAFDWLSTDANEVAKYIADPLCGSPSSVSLWIDLLQLIREAGSTDCLARLTKSMPVNLVGGEKDPATKNGKAMEWLAGKMRAAGIRDIDLTLYPDTRHETLNETVRDRATDAFIVWANRVIAA